MRTSLELLTDSGSLALSFALGRINSSRLGVWIDLSALVSMTQNMPDLREPLEKRLGSENTELLLSVAGSFADAMMRGWSGPSLDIVHRLHQYQAFLERRRVWESHQHELLHWWRDMPEYEEMPVRKHPLPEGPVEKYQNTAEKFALAGFGVGMASTHNLTKSVGGLFAAVPKPAVLGRSSYVSEMIRRLVACDVFVLEHQALTVLDRVTDIVIDERYMAVNRYHVASVLGLLMPAPELRRVAQAILDGHKSPVSEGSYWRLESAKRDSWPTSVQEWVQHQSLNSDNLRLLYCDDHLAGALVIHETRDARIISLINRIRESGINLSVVGNDPETFHSLNISCFSPSEWHSARDKIQADGGVVLAASSKAGILAAADIALGILADDCAWPQSSHLLARDWTAALWMLIEGVDRAKISAHQGVELSRIDIFSGLILSLGAMTPRTISRIKMSANGVSLLAMANSIRLAREVNSMPANLNFDAVPWHAMDASSVIEQLESSFEGLSEDQINMRLTSVSKEPAPSKAVRFRGLLWQEIANPLAPVLLAGAGLSALTGAVADAALIGLAVGINTLIGGAQRYTVESRIAKLDQQQQRLVLCVRNGKEQELEVERLLPGDIIHLRAGDVAPVDARLLAESDLEMDESSLTGESLPVRKQVAPSFSMLIAEQSCMVFQGTTVAAGEAHAIVVSLPENSEASRGVYVQSAKHGRSGVEARLDSITRMTTPVVAFAGVSLMIAGLSRQQPVSEVVGAGVSLAVAAVPEGLPIMATMAQLASSSRLANIGAIVRNPRAVEALGRMNILCADKTGTLTEGTLRLERIASAMGEFSIDDLDDHSLDVLMHCLLATPEENGVPLVHMTDAAIFQAASRHAAGAVADAASWQRLAQLPFSSDRGYHATLASRNDKRLVVVKGAPEIILPVCSKTSSSTGKAVRMSAKSRSALIDQANGLASKGYRVLVVAVKSVGDKAHLTEADIEAMSFCGFVALTDPVRPSAKAAVSQLREAGISVRMITGDHPLTASAIAERLGLDNPQYVITGAQLDAIPDWQLCQQLKDANVFARVSPRQKAKIVAALQSDGSIVGMTGDGANDAAAIRMADVGIALGENSTASARSAADLLVADGRIETIVASVVEGR
ncbi:MAG: cation-transporting P-type ATPase, partial [Alcanivoracaceae bacterium]|nr:cation-transporting P-type ATPase [Alcanivoracaceae bacterium]